MVVDDEEEKVVVVVKEASAASTRVSRRVDAAARAWARFRTKTKRPGHETPLFDAPRNFGTGL